MFKRIIIILVFTLVPFVAFAQVVPPPVPPPPPPGLPIDGLTGVLCLLGMIYGSKKINKDSSS